MKLKEIDVKNHELREVRKISRTKTAYECSCGVVGYATMASHLASSGGLMRAAIQNHEKHQVRALRRKLKEGSHEKERGSARRN